MQPQSPYKHIWPFDTVARAAPAKWWKTKKTIRKIVEQNEIITITVTPKVKRNRNVNRTGRAHTNTYTQWLQAATVYCERTKAKVFDPYSGRNNHACLGKIKDYADPNDDWSLFKTEKLIKENACVDSGIAHVKSLQRQPQLDAGHVIGVVF